MTNNPTDSLLTHDIYSDILARLNRTHYYIKRASVVEKIVFENRSFYAKFERVDERLDGVVLSQHLKKEIIIAASLLDDGYTNLLVLEYKGNEPLRFYHTVKQLFQTLDIERFYPFEGKSEKHIQIYIPTEKISLHEAHKRLMEISDFLSLKLPVEWQTLPNETLPEAYNIVTLPYKKRN